MDAKKAKINKRSKEEVLNQLALVLAEDFLARKAAGTLPKPVKRAKKSVRK